METQNQNHFPGVNHSFKVIHISKPLALDLAICILLLIPSCYSIVMHVFIDFTIPLKLFLIALTNFSKGFKQLFNAFSSQLFNNASAKLGYTFHNSTDAKKVLDKKEKRKLNEQSY